MIRIFEKVGLKPSAPWALLCVQAWLIIWCLGPIVYMFVCTRIVLKRIPSSSLHALNLQYKTVFFKLENHLNQCYVTCFTLKKYTNWKTSVAGLYAIFKSPYILWIDCLICKRSISFLNNANLMKLQKR